MSVAAIVTRGGSDPVARARLDQVVRLYRSLGLQVDVVLVCPVGDRDALAAVPRGIRRFGHLAAPQSGADAAWIGGRLGSVLRTMDGGHLVCHLDNVPAEPDREAAGVWIADCADGAGTGGDMVLAPVEPIRAVLAARGLPAVRWPLQASWSGPVVNGGMIGWCGPWSAPRCAAWSAMLGELSRRGAEPGAGLLLAGEGASAVEVPDNVAQRAVTRRSGAPATALGLGIAPGEALADDHGVTAMLLALERPVLAGRSMTDAHEGRWHLPTADDAGAAADLLMAWIADPDTLAAPLAATRAALAADLTAMTRHVGAEVRRLLEAAG